MKEMKRKLLLLIFFGVVGMNMFLFAHDDKKKAEFEEFKEKRIAFISKAMNLTADEAKAFWPLCNELQEKKFKVNQQLRNALREFGKAEKEGKSHTEEDYEKLVNLFAEAKVKEAKLEQEYIDKFSDVISAEKIFCYQRAEQQFAREMLEQRGKKKEPK
jgi:Spy/CpxP family protein refolding chaperone